MPEKWQQLWRQEHGDFAVPCLVSGRWLEFSQQGAVHLKEGEAIVVSAMTCGTEGNRHKLCELIVPREDLVSVLSLIERPKFG